MNQQDIYIARKQQRQSQKYTYALVLTNAKPKKFCYYASNFIVIYDLLREFMSFFIQSAHAAEAAQGASLFGQILLPVAFFAIFYFLVIRPQSKRTKEHRAMVGALTVGSEIIFAGGLMGRIKSLEGDYALVSLNNNTDVKVQRASVISVLPKGTIESV